MSVTVTSLRKRYTVYMWQTVINNLVCLSELMKKNTHKLCFVAKAVNCN